MDDRESRDVQLRALRIRVLAGIGISVVLFLLALPFDVARYEVVSHGGVMMLLLGWLGPLGLQLGWYANPLALVAWIASVPCTPRASAVALACAVLALVIGASSYLTLWKFEMFGRNEGEMSGPLLGFGAGIFLWTASLIVTLATAWMARRGARALAA